MTRFGTLAVAATMLAWMPASFADPINPAIREANNQISLGAGLWHQDYTEFDDDGIVPTSYLDKESGSTPAFAVAITALNETGVFADLRLMYATGETDYEGYLQRLVPSNGGFAVELTPYDTQTDNDFWDVRYQLGYMFGVHPRIALTPKAEIGYSHWQRTIEGPGGLEETYTMLRGALGGQADFALTPELVLTLEGVAGWQNADIDVDAVGLDEDLGTNPYYRIGLKLDYALSDRVHLGLSAARIEYEYDESDASDSGFIEPRSETVHTTVMAHIGFTL